MNGWIVFAVAGAVACGGSASKPMTTTQTATGPQQLPAAVLRDRARTLCGDNYQTSFDSSFVGVGEGCDWVKVDKWRGRIAFAATADKGVRSVDVSLVGAAQDTEAMRVRAFEVVHELVDARHREQVKQALARVFQKSSAKLSGGGYVGDLFVTAATEIEVQHPGERWIELQIDTARDPGDDARTPLGERPDPDEFATPANEVSPAWIADAKAACTDLIKMVSKANKLEVAPPTWKEGELYVECAHPHENIVAQFLATWAPGTRKLLYLRLAADTPAKKFSALADRLLAPLVSKAQLTVARTAAKKAPLDRKYEADGLQFGSRHDTGGFYGESHELELSVQVGYTAD